MANVVQKLYGVSAIAAGLWIVFWYLIRRVQVDFAYMLTDDLPAWVLWGLYLLYGLVWLIGNRRDMPRLLIFLLVMLPLSCFFVREAVIGLIEPSSTVPLWVFGGLLVLQGIYWLFHQAQLSKQDLIDQGLLLLILPAILIVLS